MILNNAKNIMLGLDEVSRIMLGSELIWERAGDDGKETLPLTSSYWNLFTAFETGTSEIENGAIHLKSGDEQSYVFSHAETKQKIDLTNVDWIYVSIKSVNSGYPNYLCLNTESQSTTPNRNYSVYQWSWSSSGDRCARYCRRILYTIHVG
jgi:hypothetical protein